MAVTVGLCGVSWQWQRAEAQRVHAESSPELGDLERAADDFSHAADLSNDCMLWCRSARCYLASGQFDQYRQTCETIVERYAQTPNLLNTIAWTCALSQHGIDANQVVELAQRAVAEKRDFISLNSLGAALLRAGENRQAISCLTDAIEAHGDGGTPFDWLFLAMAHHQLGEITEARQWFNQAAQWIDQQTPRKVAGSQDPYFTWDREPVLKTLRHEVESLLEDSSK